ncbi:MAG: AGE family epimerase/isomerase [Bacteroides sp.]|nr:AGE family epimerase/isomerase [Bacteroides sp.]
MKKENLSNLKEELESELKNNILSWWMEHMPDQEFGGFLGHVNHDNQVVEGAGKGSVLNTRILWTYSAAYRMFPNPEYLETAKRTYNYIISHFTDKKYGGIYWELEPDGSRRSTRKQIYAIAFAIYGLSEYYMASGDEQALKYARVLFLDIEVHAFDSLRNGYTDALNRDWSPVEDLRLSEKDQNESKTMNTHLHILEAYTNLYRVWKDPSLKDALENLLRLMLDRFVDLDSKHLNLFFDDDWTLKSSLISYGHDIEATWLILEAAEVLGDEALIELCEKLAVDMARENFNGLDEDGGLIYEYFPEENRVDSDKHWWPQAEALVGYYNAYQLSGDEEFLKKALGSWTFIKEKIVDREYGEWNWATNKEGLALRAKEKAGFWKCSYHNSRACMEIIRRINKT